MLSLSVFLEDLKVALDAEMRCRHCGQRITPCDCRCYSVTHWQDASASPGQGDLHCLGMPHQLHEPDDA